MKKVLLLPVIVLAFVVSGFASNYSEMIQVDENYVENVFADLNQLEGYVTTHQGVTLNELKALGNALVANVEASPMGVLGVCSMNGEPPMGIPSFLWGCCFGVVGLAVVYFVTDNDKEEVKKSFYGCVVGYLSVTVFYVIYVALIVSAAGA